MAAVSETIEIARPRDEVWAVLADFGTIVDWAPNVDHSCLTTAIDDGVGTTRRIQAGRNVILERVTEWDPPTALAYELEGMPPVVRAATNRWTLAGAGATTTATITSTIDTGARPPQQVAAKVIGRVLAKASRQMLAGLKSHLESQS